MGIYCSGPYPAHQEYTTHLWPEINGASSGGRLMYLLQDQPGPWSIPDPADRKSPDLASRTAPTKIIFCLNSPSAYAALAADEDTS